MRIIKVFFLLVSVFIFVEIGLRIWSQLSNKVMFSQLTMNDQVLDWRLTPNFQQGIHVNSMGFRGR